MTQLLRTNVATLLVKAQMSYEVTFNKYSVSSFLPVGHLLKRVHHLTRIAELCSN